MVRPRLAEDRYARRAAGDECLQVGIALGGSTRPPGTAEGVDPRISPCSCRRGLEERHVFWIRARPAAFDIVHAEQIQSLGDMQLVAKTETYALTLAAVSQRSIVDFEKLAHVANRLATSSPISSVCRNGAPGAAISRVRKPASSVCSTARSTARAGSSSPKE